MTRCGRLAAGLLMAAGAVSCGASVSGPTAASGTTAARVSEFHSVRGLGETPAPARIRIDAIGVRAAVEPVGRAADGTVEPPTHWGTVGWYARGPRPGDPGPAVLLGHVDSRSGPAVFYRLRLLRAGDVVLVGRTDATTATFVVRRVESYPKKAFPTEDVYLPTLDPELRLVTCGGAFDSAVGHYVDNVIVFATLQR
jgi:sortase (surface protein transpeptidase)